MHYVTVINLIEYTFSPFDVGFFVFEPTFAFFSLFARIYSASPVGASVEANP